MLGHNLSQADAQSGGGDGEESLQAGNTGTGCFRSHEHHQGAIGGVQIMDPTFDNQGNKERVEMKPILNRLKQPQADDQDTLSLQTPVRFSSTKYRYRQHNNVN